MHGKSNRDLIQAGKITEGFHGGRKSAWRMVMAIKGEEDGQKIGGHTSRKGREHSGLKWRSLWAHRVSGS